MTYRRVTLREEWFVDADGIEHERVLDPTNLDALCGFDNEPWPCSGSPRNAA